MNVTSEQTEKWLCTRTTLTPKTFTFRNFPPVLAVKEGPAYFEPLAALCVTGEVSIHVDRVFTLDEVPAALAHVGEGHALGKVVVAPS